VPAEKSIAPVAGNATVGDRECMAFSGTMVVSGRATGLAVATGSDTELGRINQMLANVSPLETPLLRQIKKFGYSITAVIGVLSVIIFSYGHWLGHMTFVELFQAVVGIAVAWFCWREAAVVAVPDEGGLTVRNLVVHRRLEWAEIVDVRFGEGRPWVQLDLADGDTLAVMAIQRADGAAAQKEARRLATLVARHTPTRRDD